MTGEKGLFTHCEMVKNQIYINYPNLTHKHANFGNPQPSP